MKIEKLENLTKDLETLKLCNTLVNYIVHRKDDIVRIQRKNRDETIINLECGNKFTDDFVEFLNLEIKKINKEIEES
jgi:hypothetical protein